MGVCQGKGRRIERVGRPTCWAVSPEKETHEEDGKEVLINEGRGVGGTDRRTGGSSDITGQSKGVARKTSAGSKGEPQEGGISIARQTTLQPKSCPAKSKYTLRPYSQHISIDFGGGMPPKFDRNTHESSIKMMREQPKILRQHIQQDACFLKQNEQCANRIVNYALFKAYSLKIRELKLLFEAETLSGVITICTTQGPLASQPSGRLLGKMPHEKAKDKGQARPESKNTHKQKREKPGQEMPGGASREVPSWGRQTQEDRSDPRDIHSKNKEREGEMISEKEKNEDRQTWVTESKGNKNPAVWKGDRRGTHTPRTPSGLGEKCPGGVLAGSEPRKTAKEQKEENDKSKRHQTDVPLGIYQKLKVHLRTPSEMEETAAEENLTQGQPKQGTAKGVPETSDPQERVIDIEESRRVRYQEGPQDQERERFQNVAEGKRDTSDRADSLAAVNPLDANTVGPKMQQIEGHGGQIQQEGEGCGRGGMEAAKKDRGTCNSLRRAEPVPWGNRHLPPDCPEIVLREPTRFGTLGIQNEGTVIYIQLHRAPTVSTALEKEFIYHCERTGRTSKARYQDNRSLDMYRCPLASCGYSIINNKLLPNSARIHLREYHNSPTIRYVMRFFHRGQIGEVRHPDREMEEKESTQTLAARPTRSGLILSSPLGNSVITRVKLRGSDTRYTQPTILDATLRLRSKTKENGRSSRGPDGTETEQEAGEGLGKQNRGDQARNVETEKGDLQNKETPTGPRMAQEKEGAVRTPATTSFDQQILDSSPPSSGPAGLTEPRDANQVVFRSETGTTPCVD